MLHLITQIHSDAPQVQINCEQADNLAPNTLVISSAAILLDTYLETDEKAPLMAALTKVRDEIVTDLDQVETVPEIYGLMYWLLADQGIDNRGESLEETADRLGDIDIENDTDQYGELIFHLKDAVERLYDIELG